MALRGDPPGGPGTQYSPHPGGYGWVPDLLEGIRRIGEVVREQVALYGTLTGTRPVRSAAAGRQAAAPEPAPGDPDPTLAKILQMPAKRKAG